MDETIPLKGRSSLLVLQNVDNKNQVYGCEVSYTAVLGRSVSQCNIVVEGDPSVSKQHCRFYAQNGVCYVEDLNSHNHTFLNGIMLTAPAMLSAGDIVQVGMTKLKVIQLDLNNGSQSGYGSNGVSGVQSSYGNYGAQGGYDRQGSSGSQGGYENGCSFPIQKRNIALAIVFSILSCGIYGIYWMVKMNDEVNQLVGETDATSGGIVFLFTILTCGLYSFYWLYKMGERCDRIKGVNDSSCIVYMLLSLIGFGIVSYCLIQDTINKAVA